MKRQFLDLVDELHQQEQEELDDNLGRVRPEIREWQRKQVEPVNFEVHVWNKLQQIEKRRAARQNYKDQLEACDTIRLTNERLVELSDLCKQYGIPDNAESRVRLSDRVLLDQFVNGIGNSF